jgi:hypothetical protein
VVVTINYRLGALGKFKLGLYKICNTAWKWAFGALTEALSFPRKSRIPIGEPDLQS